MSIVLDSTSTAVVETSKTSTITVPDVQRVVDEQSTGYFVVQPETSVVVVEAKSVETIAHGQMGPRGQDGIAEEDMVYAKRIDFISENEIYRGEAPVGTLETAPAWRIRRIVIASDSDITETWATGNAQFDKAWSNRSNYTYI
jgi:hypothetical protein